ncbi:MAG: AMP-binding protein [Gammaproteobacteria bacterium]
MNDCNLPGPGEDGASGTLGGILERTARRVPRQQALVQGATRLDYQDLNRRVDAFAAGLLGIGIRPRDHVVIWLPNCVEWNIALFALARIGAVAVTCNTRYKSLELSYLLRNSAARALITAGSFPAAHIDFLQLLDGAVPALVRGGRAQHDALVRALPAFRHLIVLDAGRALDSAATAHAFADIEAAGTRDARDRLDLIAVAPDDIALIVYTSGTTGAPKGCMLSHRALCIRAAQRTRMFPWRSDERMLVTMPYSHIAGVVGPILGSTLMGTTQVLMDVFDAGEALRTIERERITFMSGVPTMFLNMLAHPHFARHDLRSLRTVTLGSADIPPDLVRRLADPAGGLGLRVLVMYGQTETGGATHCSRADDPIDLLATTAGVAIEGIEDRIVDPATGRDCAPGEEGEIRVRGAGMMSGYYAMPDATAARVRDGWLHTGDLGRRDGTGHLRVTGRLSDVILVGGFNTYPAEIENYLRQHPDIREVAVVGVPDPIMGQAVMAFVVPAPGAGLAPRAVRDFLAGRIANFKVPRFVKVVPELPMTASGKVQKFRLLEGLDAQGLAPFAVG